MKKLHRMAALLLALVLVLSLAAPGLEVRAAEDGLIEIKVDGYQNYDEVQAVYQQVNAQRQANGLPALVLHPILNNYAMQRAAELQVFYSHMRPDGTEYYTVMDSVFQNGESSENIALGEQDADAVMKCWMESDVHRAAILEPNYKSVGIGCFYTEDGTIAWVQIFSSEDWHMTDRTTGVRQVEDVPVQMLGSNVVAQLDHNNFSNKFCALYVYEGTTIGTGLSLLNVGVLGKYIPIDENTDLSGYTYISGDPNILSVNNDNRTLTAVAPGKTTLRIQHNGEDVLFHDAIASYLTYELTVEVMELPSLSYETDGSCYAIDYSGFNTSAWSGLCLWIKGNHDEMWMMGNIERDGVYDFYPMDMTDTYVCVMRYFDEYLDRYVEVGDRLIIQLGDEEPEPPEEPSEPAEPEETEPTEPAEPEIFVPTAEDLPQRDKEPSMDEVRQIMAELKQTYYPNGTEWPEGLEYVLSVDAQDNVLLEYSYGWIAAVSDLIFGTLPARVISQPALDDLRPGDILSTWDGGDILITDVAEDYIEGACVSNYGEICWRNLHPVSILSNAFLITRYESDAPGVDAVSIGILPKDAVIVAQGDESCYNNRDELLSFVRWALTEDNTLYIYGDGSGVDIYKGAYYVYGWEKYRLQITGLVVDGCLDDLADGLFAVNYPNLQEVTIRGEMEELNTRLFYQSAGLERVTLANVESIGERAFAGCSALKAVIMLDTTVSIEKDAFANCIALTDVHLPQTLKSIGDHAFNNCAALTEIQFPDGLEAIGAAAFEDCDLRELNLPAGLHTLGAGAFSDLKNLKKVFLDSDIATIASHLFSGCTAIEEVAFGENVTKLAEYMFSGASSLKTVTIPGSITDIPEGIFRYCDGLETVIIESGVETIGMYAFHSLMNLKELHLPNTLKRIEEDAFYNLEGMNVDFYFYGTPEQWETIEIESGNHGLELWAWKFNFVDPDTCRHTNTRVVPGYDPTCTEAGLTDGIVCADCGEILVEQEVIPAHGHKETETITEPTCTEGGFSTFTCALCGAERVDAYTDPLGHDWDGLNCRRCGAVNENPFVDVAKSDYFYTPVLWAVENGITAGTGNGKFSPEDTCTRAQVVTFLWRAMGKPAPKTYDNPFVDVDPGAYYYEAVLWAVDNGITAGTGSGKFSPDDPCTRAQVVTFLWRAMSKPAPDSEKNPFGDVFAGDYYYEPVLWAVENGITSGTGNGRFSPEDPCTRGQVVTFLYRTEH